MSEQTDPPNLSCPIYPFSCGAPFYWLGHSIPIPSSKSYFLIHELILLMLEQYTNPGPSFPCPICHHQQIKSQYFHNYWLLIWLLISLHVHKHAFLTRSYRPTRVLYTLQCTPILDINWNISAIVWCMWHETFPVTMSSFPFNPCLSCSTGSLDTVQ